MSDTDDICDFIKQYLASALPGAGVDHDRIDSLLTELDQTMRQHYGGDRHYVRQHISKAERHAAILRDWRARVPKRDIAHRNGVHIATVNRIIQQHLHQQTTQRAAFASDDWCL